MSKGGGSTKTETRPFAESQRQLQIDIANRGQDLLAQGPQQFFPGDLTPTLSYQTRQAVDAGFGRSQLATQPNAAQRFAGGSIAGPSAIPGLAQGNFASSGAANLANRGLAGIGFGNSPLGQTARGDFLTANPYLQDTFDRASRAVTDQYQKSIAPGIDSRFASSGRVGSGLHAAALKEAQYGLGENLSNLATDIFAGDYQQERGRQVGAQSQIAGNQLSAFGQLGGLADAAAGRQLGATSQQLQAAGLIPALNADNRADIGLGFQAGGVLDRQNIAEAQEAADRFNFAQNAPYAQLGALLPFAGATGTVSQGPSQARSPLAGALGGAATGAGIASALSLSNPASAAAVLGAGVLGGLG